VGAAEAGESTNAAAVVLADGGLAALIGCLAELAAVDAGLRRAGGAIDGPAAVVDDLTAELGADDGDRIRDAALVPDKVVRADDADLPRRTVRVLATALAVSRTGAAIFRREADEVVESVLGRLDTLFRSQDGRRGAGAHRPKCPISAGMGGKTRFRRRGWAASKPVPVSVAGGGGAGLDAELGEDAGDVAFDGGEAEEVGVGDRPVRPALRQQAQDVELARRQLGPDRRRERAGGWGGAVCRCDPREGLGDGLLQRQRPPLRPPGGERVRAESGPGGVDEGA
jgi:hypothetical protein